MPAVGSISTNLSLSDVAALVTPEVGFLIVLGLTTTGFLVVSGFGLADGLTDGLTDGFTVGFGFARTGGGGAAFGVIASCDCGPLPLRPSITILPSWV